MYLHGNGGALDSWGNYSTFYTDLGYDVFLVDYRGFGKSEGTIESEAQFYSDMEACYQGLEKRYGNSNIIILGFSLGTCVATKLAADHDPKLLVLQAPYYSIEDMMGRNYPAIPTILLKYKFPTHHYLDKVKSPVVIFHGIDDRLIPFESSEMLQKHLKPTDTLIPLPNQGHNNIIDHPTYHKEFPTLIN